MNKLAQMTGEERRRLVTNFLDDVFADLEEGSVESRMRQAMPELPDDPSPEQVEAWVELAELIQDPDFRARAREMSVKGMEANEQPPGEDPQRASQLTIEKAGQALADGVDPASEAAGPVIDELAAAFAATGEDPADPAYRAELADRMATFTDRRVERYWQLTGVINGWGQSMPSMVPIFEWFIEALRAHR